METKIATSVNQSKTLIDLGIDVHTADMHYSKWDNDEEEKYYLKCGELPMLDFKYVKNIPAWSLSALMELMDDETSFTKEYTTWVVCDIRNTHRSENHLNPIDAAFEIVCYLLENKLIK